MHVCRAREYPKLFIVIQRTLLNYCVVIVSPFRGLAVSAGRRKPWLAWLLVASNATGVALIAGALWRWGAVEVRGHSNEVLFLTLVGFAWLVASACLFPWFGLGGADDVVERQNSAALFALMGATLAVALVYAGGNLGEGPSYWNNIFSAGVGTIAFFMLWLVLELGGRVSFSIAEERDKATGIRVGGFFVSIGLMLARAVAGNWHSEAATVSDLLRDGWPTGVLCCVAVLIEWLLRPSAKCPFPNWPVCGLLPALLYLGCAVAWIVHLRRWEGMPQ